MTDKVERSEFRAIDRSDINYDRFSTTRIQLIELDDREEYAIVAGNPMPKHPTYEILETANTKDELRDLEDWKDEIESESKSF